MAVSDTLRVWLGSCEVLNVALGVADAGNDAAWLCDTLLVDAELTVTETLTLPVADVEGVGVCVRDGVTDGEAAMLAVDVPVSVTLGLRVAVTLILAA